MIGLIIAGGIIGPFGLFLMSRDSNMIMLGNAGILYIMFLAGLEIDAAEFRKNSSKSLVFGMLTFSIPMIIGYFAAYYLLELSVVSSILLASMFASHTLIAYPIISKLGAGKNRAVTVAIGGTMITDTLALSVLAVIVSMHEGEATSSFWLKLFLSIAVFAVVVLTLFPIIGRWFFKTFHDNTSQFIFVLVMMFLGGLLAELAGVEAIIGAFLAGLAMNKLIPHVSPLMNRIDFVGNALFIPIFLISVGMLIDYRAFVNGFETVKVAAVMTVTAISAKFLAAFIIQKIYGYSHAERKLIFGLSNAQAAATLAAVTVGHSAGFLNDAILNGTIVMILVTCTIASFRAQKGAMELAFSENTAEDNPKPLNDEKILIPISNKDTLKDLVDLSLVIKSKRNRENVYALNIIKSDEKEKIANKSSELLLEEAVRLGAGADTFIQPLRRYDFNVVNGILGVVKKYSITDIVMGLHVKQVISESFLGNLVEEVLDNSHSTMFIYKAVQPLSTVKRRYVLIPPHAEKEVGFSLWLSKIWNLSRNTSSKLCFYAEPHVLEFLRQIHRNHPIDAEFELLEKLDVFSRLSQRISSDEGLIIVMSRRGKISYHEFMQQIPEIINRHFLRFNFMLIYPVQEDYGGDSYLNHSSLEAIDTLEGI